LCPADEQPAVDGRESAPGRFANDKFRVYAAVHARSACAVAGMLESVTALNMGENPVPHYWEHTLWVWGQTSMDDFEKLWDRINLDGVVERIRVPYLVVHGAHDRQIPVEYAHRSYEQAVNSPKRELKVFTEREGGVEHCNLDDPMNATRFVADWVAETFGHPVR
jgi:esterase/lipase